MVARKRWVPQSARHRLAKAGIERFVRDANLRMAKRVGKEIERAQEEQAGLLVLGRHQDIRGHFADTDHRITLLGSRRKQHRALARRMDENQRKQVMMARQIVEKANPASKRKPRTKEQVIKRRPRGKN